MPITELLERNHAEARDEVALVEINPDMEAHKHVNWMEYELIQPAETSYYRREMTWKDFDHRANRVAHFLLSQGIKKGDKVAILMMNCLDWLPIYFGILKSGALAVPMNFRFDAEEIKYCLELSETDMLIFGPEFIDRLEKIKDDIKNVQLFYVGGDCPDFANDFDSQIHGQSYKKPDVTITDDDYAAIYFSSGTTGFPKAILHKQRLG